MNNPFNQYNGDNSMTYNVTDAELNANYEPEEVETFLDRRLKRQRELKQLGEPNGKDTI